MLAIYYVSDHDVTVIAWDAEISRGSGQKEKILISDLFQNIGKLQKNKKDCCKICCKIKGEIFQNYPYFPKTKEKILLFLGVLEVLPDIFQQQIYLEGRGSNEFLTDVLYKLKKLSELGTMAQWPLQYVIEWQSNKSNNNYALFRSIALLIVIAVY